MSFFDLYKWAVVPLIRRLGGHVPGEPAAPPPSQHHQHSRACVSAAPDSPLSLGLCAIPAPQSGLGTAGPTRGHLSQPKTRTCFKQDVTRSDVKGAGEVSSSSFFLLFLPPVLCPAVGQERWGRPCGRKRERMMWIWYLLLGSGSGSRTVGKFPDARAN